MNSTIYIKGQAIASPDYDGTVIDVDSQEAAIAELVKRAAIRGANEQQVANTDAITALTAAKGDIYGLQQRVDQIRSDLNAISEAHLAAMDAAGDARKAASEALNIAKAVPAADVAAVARMGAEVVTEGARAVNRAAAASQEISEQFEALRAEAEALRVETAQLVNTAQTITADFSERTNADLMAAALRAEERLDGVIASMQEPIGIAEVSQEEADSFTLTLTDGTTHQIKLPQGPRGYRGQPGKSGMPTGGGGGGGGSAGSKLIGAAAELTLTASQETEIRHRNLTQAVKIKGDADFRVKVVAIGNLDQWSSFTLSTAAATAAAAADSAFTIAPDFSGTAGEVPMAFRVVRQANGDLQLFATAGVNCYWTSTVSAVTEVS